MSARSALLGAGYLALWRAVSLMPDRLAYKTMESLFALQYRTNAAQTQRLRETFAPVVDEADLEKTVEEAYRWYARYWAEAFRLPAVSREELDSRFTVDGVEHIQGAIDAGRGGILATMHLGNWDTGGRWVASRWPMTAVAERLEPRALFERFLGYRRELGMKIIPLEKGRDVTGACAELLRANELVALLADRDLSGRGVPVRFFGRTAKMARGPAVLAARTGAPVLPAVIYQREDGAHHAVVNPPLPPTADESPEALATTIQRLAEAYEAFVRVAPAQWHMFQRFWPDEANLASTESAA